VANGNEPTSRKPPFHDAERAFDDNAAFSRRITRKKLRDVLSAGYNWSWGSWTGAWDMSFLDPTAAFRPRIVHEALAQRVEAAQAILSQCDMCELRCGANRLAGQVGPCRLGAGTFAYKQYLSLNEESELLPAWRVFLGGCNFRCPYCDEAPEARQTEIGWVLHPRRWAKELSQALARGAKTISLLGGEPSLHVHTILAAVAASADDFPLAFNTNMYMTPKVLDLLDGIVHWYLADLKFGNDACAERLAGVPRYTEVVRRNIARVFPRTGLIIRHVLLPGHGECCFRPIADWVSQNLPQARFQLYPGYVPCGEARSDPTIGRLNTPDEIRFAESYLNGLDLQCEITTPDRAVPPLPAPRDGTGSAGITIGADGRLYCHDLTPELFSILSRLCAAWDNQNDELRPRRATPGRSP
jgi:putative pyruvate formate lyase activating enzyme